MNPTTLTYAIPSHPTWDFLDPSKIKSFMHCPRAFLFEYIFGWRSNAPNVDLIFGTSWHLIMEEIFQSGYNVDAVLKGVAKAKEYYDSKIPVEEQELIKKCNIKNIPHAAHAAIEYISHYITDNYTVYANEIGVITSLADHKICGKIDLVLQDNHTKKFWIADHKTSGWSFNDLYDSQWRNATPFSTYLHMLLQMLISDNVGGIEDIGGFIISSVGLRELKNKPSDYKNPPPGKVYHFKEDTKTYLRIEFHRIEMTYSPDDVYGKIQESITWIDWIKENFRMLSEASIKDEYLKAFPRSGTGIACTEYMHMCPYYGLCMTQPNPLAVYESNPNGFKVEYWDPLLEENIKERRDLSS